ncbi:MAG: hypothetical protein RI964_1394 [Pseudomonadota bacterium]|jgi:hypothetical protein
MLRLGYNQFSTTNPDTRLNSSVLSVTATKPNESVCVRVGGNHESPYLPDNVGGI